MESDKAKLEHYIARAKELEDLMKSFDDVTPKLLENNKGIQEKMDRFYKEIEDRNRELTTQIEYLKALLSEEEDVEYVWGSSDRMKAIYDTIKKVAETDSTVLITGESGAGKEVVARTIHRLSRRKDKPFLCVNCAALSAGLLESELFGHEKGAFTGADKMRRGRFELAEGGTLLLDEVSEIDLDLQAKLLRVLQEKTYERVGNSEPRRADVRVLATTNRDLRQAISKGLFREDLYYRLNVVPLYLPSLRDRKDDIPQLVEHFLKRFCGKSAPRTVPKNIMKLLLEYAWPGNVRELGNIIERAVVLSKDGELREEVIAPWLEGRAGGLDTALESLVGLKLDEIEDRLIMLSLSRCGGNKEKAAEMLGISSRTLRDRLKKVESAAKG